LNIIASSPLLFAYRMEEVFHIAKELGYDGVEVWHDGLGITVFSRLGAPYFNEHAAYLDIDLSSRLDGHELAKSAKRFSAREL